MVWVKGRPRRETVFPTMDRVAIGRYSVRWPAESRGAAAAARASVEAWGTCRIGKRVSVFAIYSPHQNGKRLAAGRQVEVLRGSRGENENAAAPPCGFVATGSACNAGFRLRVNSNRAKGHKYGFTSRNAHHLAGTCDGADPNRQGHHADDRSVHRAKPQVPQEFRSSFQDRLRAVDARPRRSYGRRRACCEKAWIHRCRDLRTGGLCRRTGHRAG